MNSNGLTAAIYQSVARVERVLVYRHTNPDPDAIGTQFGLTLLLRRLFPDKTIRAIGTVPPALTWISPTDTDGHDLTVTSDDLVIAVDCANHERLAGELPGDAFVIKIDHHPNRDPYGQLNWVDPTYSSCAEMVYAFYAQQANNLDLPQVVAAALYAGIIGDTVRFSTPETSAATLATASHLAATGIPVDQISHHATDLSPRLSKLYGYVLSHLTVDQLGLGHVTLSQTVLRTLEIPYGEEDAIVPLPGNLTNVKVWLIFIATPQGNYRVHFRSKGPAVDGVAKQFNGGGHPLASGTFVPNSETIPAVIAAMRAAMK